MRKTAIGIQNFEKIRKNNVFYVDKTGFIKEWWERMDDVTLIARPRRFGKTLTMDMLNKFFSLEYVNRGDLFEGLEIFKDGKYRELQGSYPVIFLSFANVKEKTYERAKIRICQILSDLYIRNSFLLEAGILKEQEKNYFKSVNSDMDEVIATISLQKMCEYLYRYYGKKPIILLDEYDTPMQEAYVDDYWNKITRFFRNMFNATFKTNQYLERAVMTGITRVSKESIFSDLNNLKVVTTTSDEYADCFGFTEKEVFDALEEFGYGNKKEEVKAWYDGFTFGKTRDIYNPWSIINFLDTGKFNTYWANTSSNSLVDKLIREGGREIKLDFEALLKGECIELFMDEQVVYNQLNNRRNAVWSLLLACGYLRVEKVEFIEKKCRLFYTLKLTNREVFYMFDALVYCWFSNYTENYNDFIKALLKDDLKSMNIYMNQVSLETFSFFDSGKKPSDETQPERFYHGFVLGLMVDLRDRYAMTSNRESGFGRYDVCLEPLEKDDPAIIIEFKVMDSDEEKDLTESVQSALKQIEDMKYEASVIAKGIPESQIRKYGFAFQGKKVLIGKG